MKESCNEWNDSDHEVAKESLSSEEQEPQPCHSRSVSKAVFDMSCIVTLILIKLLYRESQLYLSILH